MTDASYVANIKVEKVVKSTNRDHGSASHGAVRRDVVETINLTIKASSINTLKEKVAAHISLLDEEDLS